jgi:hypothetical protein
LADTDELKGGREGGKGKEGDFLAFLSQITITKEVQD